MKKHVLLAKMLMVMAFTGVLSWGSLSSVYAQVGSYSFAESTETYAQITGTTSTATGDDGSQNGVAIGFTFNFGGTDYTTFSINTNGFIRLGANIGGSSWSNTITSANSTQSPVIAAFWDDNNLSTGTIRYTTSGSAPNRVLTVDWNQTKIGGVGSTGGSSNNMQIRLYETTNNIELVYGSTFTTSNTVTAFVGINNAGSFVSVTPGNPSTFSNATQNHDINNTVMQNLAGKKLTFTPPSCVAPSGLNASLVSTTEANFSWNAATPIPGVGYEWAVTTSATPPASGTATAGLTANINTLSANEVYFLHVRSECTAGVFSGWSTFSFVTLEGNDCGLAQNLGALTSPFTGTTVGFTNNFTNSCLTGTGGDRVFKIDVPNNYALFIGQSVNDYDSRHRIAVGGACPGTTEINTGYAANFPTLTTTGTTAGCLDDSDLTHYYYNNSTGSTQTVYWVQDGHSSGQGTFTLEWQLVEIPSVPSCASNIVASQDPNCGNFALTISWDAVATATGYKISMGTTPGGTNIANNQNIGAITAFVINSPQLNTQYFYTVTPYNIAGDAVGCTEGSFTTGSTPCFLPGENCGVAQDLATLTSPFTGTTVGYTDDFNISCISGTATDRIFFMEVPNNHSLFIGQSVNNYDSKHRFAVGGACPGDNPINTGYVANFPTQLTNGTISGCLDDNDLTHYFYNNNTGSAQTVYWLQDGYSSGQGTFTLEWELIENPPAPDCASNFVATPTPGCDNGTISLSWDAAATATGYKITVGTTSGGTDIANNLDLGNVLTVNLTNPELNTTYFFTLVPYNMGGDAVGCAEEQFTTGGIGCHCEPTYTTGKTDGDLIANVEIIGTTLSNSTGTAQVNPAYTYFTGQPNYTADLVAGTSYTVSVSVGAWGSQHVAVWIDFNDDGVFDTPSERIGFTTTPIAANSSATFTVSLPCNPTPGTYRMRVRNVFATLGNTIDPCANYSYGETEDYDVTVLPPPPCPSVTGLAAGTPTSNSVVLNWNQGCAESAWNVEYGSVGFTPGTGTTVPAGTNVDFDLTGLSSSTSYHIYVSADCGVDGNSAPFGPIQITTDIAPCNGAPIQSNTLSSAPSACLATDFTLSLSETYNDLQISYQWQSSDDNNIWNDIVGATNPTRVQTQSDATWYRCVVTCDATNDEMNSTPIFVPMSAPNQCYCVAQYSSGKTAGDLISNVAIPGTTLANNSGTAQVNPAYTYFTGPTNTAELIQGGSYNVTISVGTWGNQHLRAWIDYNDNGVFEDAESIGYDIIAPGLSNSGPFAPAVFGVNLSLSAPLGTHRMRIRSVWASSPDMSFAQTIDPCISYGFGETEDYDITIVAPVTTQLQPSSCGATNVQMSDVLGAIQVPHGGYRFRIIGANDGSAGWNGNTFILDRPVRNFRFSHVPGSLWGETYSVEVAVGDGFGNYGPYGASCDVTLASLPPTTQLQSSQCNITDVSQTTFLFANQVNNVAGYRFRIVGANNGAQGWTGNTFILDRPSRDFRFSMVPGVIWGETYSVEVAVLSLDNVTYGLYGTACNVTLQGTPTTALQSSQCGITNVAQNTALFANTVNGAAGYRFRVVGTNDGSQGWVVDTYILDRPVKNFKFNMIPGVLQGEEYEVQVAVMDANGNYGAYGSVCTITLEGAPDFVINDDNQIFLNDKTMSVVEFGASASHNPFTTDFEIQVLNANDIEAINVVIYDMSGKLIESNTVNPMEIESARFGQNLAAGMYMITVVQGSNQAVIRQVKN